MSSRRGNKPFNAYGSGSGSGSGSGCGSGSGSGSGSNGSDQLGKGIANVSLNSGQDNGGWEVFSKKSKNKTVTPWAPQNNPPSNAWGNSNTSQKLGFRTNPVPAKAPVNEPRFINPPAPVAFDWSKRPKEVPEETEKLVEKVVEKDDEDDTEEELVDDSDDDFQSDEYDSDTSVKSHETRTKSRWFKELFECMDALTVQQINDPERQWHCPACKNGPGAIDWYKGLQPLITHAKTKGSTRVKLHRELAVLLDEELRRRGTTAIPSGEIFGQWKGLDGVEKQIVWPPMVIIENTRLDKDDNDKWIGMGNAELLAYFDGYNPQKARHSYGPDGHKGMSILIFEQSAVGYLAAESLSRRFEADGRDRLAWDRRRGVFYTGQHRDLFGYIAERKDMDEFNKHSQGKSMLKFEMKSYQEMVVRPLKQMNEENQQLMYFKNKMAKEKQTKKALQETFGIVTEKLRKTSEENRIIRERTKKHHEDNKAAMEYQENFFKERLKSVHDARKEKEEMFEKIQLEEREKSSGVEVLEVMEEMETEFSVKKGMLVSEHEKKMLEMQKRHNEEALALEREFNAQLTKLMEMHSPSPSSL